MLNRTGKNNAISIPTVPHQIKEEESLTDVKRTTPKSEGSIHINADNISARSIKINVMSEVENLAINIAQTINMLDENQASINSDLEAVEADAELYSEDENCSSINFYALFKEVKQIKRELSLSKESILLKKEALLQFKNKHQSDLGVCSKIDTMKEKLDKLIMAFLEKECRQAYKTKMLEKHIIECYVSKVLTEINDDLLMFVRDTACKDGDIKALEMKQYLHSAIEGIPVSLLSHSMLAAIDRTEKYISQQLLESSANEPDSDEVMLESLTKELPEYIKKFKELKSAIGTGKSYSQNTQKLDSVLSKIVQAQCSPALSSSKSLMDLLKKEEASLFLQFKKLKKMQVSQAFTHADFLKKKSMYVKTNFKAINKKTPKNKKSLIKQRLLEIIALSKKEVTLTTGNARWFEKHIFELEILSKK